MARTPDTRAQNGRFVAFLKACFSESGGVLRCLDLGWSWKGFRISSLGQSALQTHLSKPGHFLPLSATFFTVGSFRRTEKEIARRITELAEEPVQTTWPFAAMLKEITSTAPATLDRPGLLGALREGSKVKL
jgi:hypothetical protein